MSAADVEGGSLLVKDMARINLEPDEVLFVTIDDKSPARIIAAQTTLARFFGERVIVAGPGVTMRVVQKPAA